jgi:L-amino acid N-acyltransferase YncA
LSERLRIRDAHPADAEAIARIWRQGIEDRVATFETRAPNTAQVAEAIAGPRPFLVAELDGEPVGFAKVGPYDDPSGYYGGVGEATLYVERGARRGGVGQALLEALAEAAEDAGLFKLVGKIFTSNARSIGLVRACGWREVGVHLRHGRLDGQWKDVLVVEKLLGEAAS